MPGGTRSYELGRRLVQMGHEVHMVTADQESKGWGVRRSTEDGIRVTWIRSKYSNRMGFLRRIWSFLEYAVGAAMIGLVSRPDVIFATSTPLTIGLPGIFLARVWGVPLVFEVRDLWPDIPIAMGVLKSRGGIRAARWLETFCYQNSDHIVALSPGMKDGVVRCGIDEAAVTTIPNLCVDDFTRVSEDDGIRVREELGIPSGRKVVLYAGTLGRVNNVGYLVEVAEAGVSREDGPIYLVVGDGAEREMIEDAAREAGVLGRNFLLIGAIEKSQMRSVFSVSDLAVSTVLGIRELEDNSANKIFDALAAGRPIAVNHGGWQSEMILRERIGIVLSRDPKIAAQQVEEFLEDSDGVRSARLSCLRVSAMFSADLAASRLESILGQAVRRHETGWPNIALE